MTEQLKAEAYVREQRPALMKEVERWSDAGMSWLELPALNLQDWLAELENHTNTIGFSQGDVGQNNTLVAYPVYQNIDEEWSEKIRFNLTTGQPATEADFKIFNEIVSV